MLNNVIAEAKKSDEVDEISDFGDADDNTACTKENSVANKE